MERFVLGFNITDKKRNKWIQEQNKITDVICRVKKLKWIWACTLPEEMMTDGPPKFYIGNVKRPRKKPQCHRRDEIQNL